MEIKDCELCGKKFETVRFHSNQKFCSKKCKDKVQEMKLKQNNPNYRRDYFKGYWEGYYEKNKHKISEKQKKKRKEKPEEFKARQELNNALQYGKIKLNINFCEFCGSKKSLVKHHPNYSIPLHFILLCRSCHGKLHNKLKIYDDAEI